MITALAAYMLAFWITVALGSLVGVVLTLTIGSLRGAWRFVKRFWWRVVA